MSVYLVAERYANGLSAALADAELESALAAIQEVVEVIESHHEFRSCLGNPSIDVALRTKVLDNVLGRMGCVESVVRLMHELLERGRISIVARLAAVFEELVDARLGRVMANVTTAIPLTTEQVARLEGGLARFSDKTVRLKCEVDPEIISGVMARIGDRVVDGTLRTRLQRVKDALIAEEL